MTALLAAFGWKVFAIIGAALVALAGFLMALWNAKASGVAKQQALDIKQKEQDNATAAKARSDVDALSDSAVDQRLHDFQRK